MTGQALATIKPAKVPAVPPKKSVPAVPPPEQQRPEAARVINEFQSDTVEIDTRPEPLAARAVLLVLAALFSFVVLWATFSHLDRLVSARGRVVATTPNIIVQPLEAAIVRSIEVEVGDIVTAGTILATLDPTFADADVEQLRARLAALDALIARLIAEQQRRPFLAAQDGRYDYETLQQAIWGERQTQFEAQMRLFDERMARANANIASAQAEIDHLSKRLGVVREVETMRAELEQSQTGSRLNLLVARDARIEVQRNLAKAQNDIVEFQHEMEAIQAEREVFRRKWDGEIVEELVTKRNERDGLQEQFIKASRRRQMVSLETPVDAVVLEVAPRSVGSIVREAEPFFTLVPLDAPLEVEALIEAREIGYVRVGDEVRLKLDAFTFQDHGVAEGVVKIISGDAFSDNRKAIPDSPEGAFYKARIEITKIDLRNVPEMVRLIPGLPLTAEIKVGQRRVISYFLRPILRGVNESMREP